MPRPYFHKDQVMDELIRVNHAGEYGAIRIYQGQISSFPNDQLLQYMLKSEEKHLKYFNNYIKKFHHRPTVFLPLWHLCGYILGRVTSMIGYKEAMLCTEAVEEVINEHYQEQIPLLENMGYVTISHQIEQFRLEELEHHYIAVEKGSKESTIYFVGKIIIHKICRAAILMSKIL